LERAARKTDKDTKNAWYNGFKSMKSIIKWRYCSLLHRYFIKRLQLSEMLLLTSLKYRVLKMVLRKTRGT